ncbi:MAG: hypothetical protein LBH61_07765 [Dysgonamonadaceae bacterium]|jgi:DNA-binding SARP family transcriptional activator|nr:hypothetical protein [Dysgonamonadaceae bacterium]
MKAILTVLITILTVSFSQANDVNYGLYFKSYADFGKDRTSLVVNNGRELKLQNETSVSFDVFIRKELEFGYILHIISDSGDKIALNFSADSKNSRYPSLIINENFYPVTNKITFEKWFPVSLRFSAGKDSLHLSYDDIKKSYPLNFKDWSAFKVVFGICLFQGFETFETAAVNIRDVRIYNRETLIRHWPLKEHNNSLCYDLVNHIPALAVNPQWLIDSHANWKKIYAWEFGQSNNPQYAFDGRRDIFYLVPDEKTIIAHHLVSGKDSTIQVKGGYPASISTNGLVYDHLNDELLSYNLDEKTISRFSFKRCEWSKATPCKEETRFWHHTMSINEADSSLVAFGGYGYYHYKNDLFTVKLNGETWERNQLLTLMPRYSAASVVVDNQLYIFGGRGSETGKQEVNPQHKYDLYSVDLRSGETTFFWETQSDALYLPCGNMIYNPSDSCFYVLTNIENGTLIRITTRHSSIEKVSRGINQPIRADFLFYNVFFSPGQQKLYALFCSNLKQGPSLLSLYEMNFPPVTPSEIQGSIIQKSHLPGSVMVGITAGLALGIAAYCFFASRRKKAGKRQPAIGVQGEKEATARHPEIVPDRETPAEPAKTFDRTKQCISLLGGFNVMDREGNNITSNFTPILKNLLLLILLYSEIEEKGINNKKIDSLLWSGKEDKAARNNRNVSLTRLKLLLENVGNISLLNNNGFWKISFGEDVFCDYHTTLLYIKRHKKDDTDQTNLLKLLELLMYGQLLPYTQADWLDRFKSNYSSDAIDVLYNLLLSKNIVKDEKLSLQIADTIFLFDSLNEEALGIKCSILYNSGKKGLAKSTYDSFVKEYKAMLGDDYRYSLPKVMEAVQTLKIRS